MDQDLKTLFHHYAQATIHEWLLSVKSLSGDKKTCKTRTEKMARFY